MKTLMVHVSLVMFGEFGISRAEREMVVDVVSATNSASIEPLITHRPFVERTPNHS